MKRGEVWWASLPEPSGSEPGYRRPVVIVQADRFTASSIATVLAVVLTTNQRLAQAPGNVLLTRQDTGLARDSVANVTQVITVDKTACTECVGQLAPAKLHLVEAGLRLSLGL